MVEGWHAPALVSAGPEPWTEDQLTTYLRTGFSSAHGAAAGPMTAVSAQLAAVPETDVRAIAVYLASLKPDAATSDRATTAAPEDPTATAIFDGACGACHAAPASNPPLERSAALRAPTAGNAAEVILHGLPWREGHAGPYMPGFAASLTDAQAAGVLALLRGRSGNPPWPDVDSAVRAARQEGGGT